MMPGLIDAHWHAAFTTLPSVVAMTADPGYIHMWRVALRRWRTSCSWTAIH